MKYRFMITYQTDRLKRVSEIMSKLDFGFNEIFYEEEWRFEGKDTDVATFKQTLIDIFAQVDCRIVHIEGGKIE